MHLRTRNVNSAFNSLVRYFLLQTERVGWTELSGGPVVRKQSRNGPVLMIEEPVLVTYTHPQERVLFNTARDCNPFFHLYESLWMLAGRNDVAPLAYYAENMKNYSDDGKTLNGAYGYRWRQHHCDKSGDPEGHVVDQLKLLINHLKADPTSRRAVLQMWNVEDDLLKVGPSYVCKACKGKGQWETGPHGEYCRQCDGFGNTLKKKMSTLEVRNGYSSDVCCNLSVMFSLRESIEIERDSPKYSGKIGDRVIHGFQDAHRRQYLDMTVTNRSNDMIWGMLGANYVHFTVLQEYMAAHLGVEVGVYNHFTNNLHVYENNWKPEEWLSEYSENGNQKGYVDYDHCNLSTVALVKDPAVFDKELSGFVEAHKDSKMLDAEMARKLFGTGLTEPFLKNVAHPMLMAFHAHKLRKYDAASDACSYIKADDWRIAATQWIEKRKQQWEARQAHKEQYSEFGGSD